MEHGQRKLVVLAAGMALTLGVAVHADEPGTMDQSPPAAGSFLQTLNWHHYAARKGHAEAQYRLGLILEQGRGRTPDPVQAAQWFGKAADQGHVEAAYHLGLMLYEGRGVPRDLAEAASRYRAAASSGHAVAAFNLGLMLERGQGKPRDLAGAVSWYEKAVAGGVAAAATQLALLHLRGAGVDQQPARALMWIVVAQGMGATGLEGLRGQLEGSLPADAVAEALRLAAERRPQHPGDPPAPEPPAQ